MRKDDWITELYYKQINDKQEIITIQGRMFQVKRKFPQHRINLKRKCIRS